mmetsp:Transcript_8476/g.10462  ORF Transcript_8476/g.10462 Transcript_8476/m.10462 type:complete len:189 (-) Transcript_8476:201-767(-)
MSLEELKLGLQYRLAVCGLCGCGKSALVRQFVEHEFVEDFEPTVEKTFLGYFITNDEPEALSILDTAGAGGFSTLQYEYMRGGRGFLIVFDLTSRASFEELASVYGYVLCTRDADSCPMVIVGTKCDLGHERKVTRDEGQHFADSIGRPYIETSALARFNVDEAFNALVHEINKDYANTRKSSNCSFM